jgi:hypothetical protein
MSDIKKKYPAAGQPVTVTLASLAASTANGRESMVVDNSTDLYNRVRIHVATKTANTGTVGGKKSLLVYWYSVILDDGTPSDLYPGNVTGSDADLAAVRTQDLNYLGAIELTAINTAYKRTFTIDNPGRKWGLVFINDNNNVPLSATAEDHAVHYYGEWDQVV